MTSYRYPVPLSPDMEHENSRKQLEAKKVALIHEFNGEAGNARDKGNKHGPTGGRPFPFSAQTVSTPRRDKARMLVELKVGQECPLHCEVNENLAAEKVHGWHFEALGFGRTDPAERKPITHQWRVLATG